MTEFLNYTDEHGMDYVVRIHHDHRVTVGGTDGIGTAKLRETLRNAEEWGRRTETGLRNAIALLSVVAVVVGDASGVDSEGGDVGSSGLGVGAARLARLRIPHK